MNILKIIKEELEKVIINESLENKIKKDIHYLKDFSLNKKEQKKDLDIWIFEHKIKDYTIRFYVQKNNITNKWKTKIFIYWKIPTRNFTNAKGKDYDFTYGPFISYNEMIIELNRKLKNNPLISTSNYLDDNMTQMDNDIIEMMKLLKKRTNELNQVKDKHFNDIKKISLEIKNINNIEDLKKYIEKKAEGEGDKQTILLILQKLYQVKFYKQKEDLESLF